MRCKSWTALMLSGFRQMSDIVRETGREEAPLRSRDGKRGQLVCRLDMICFCRQFFRKAILLFCSISH